MATVYVLHADGKWKAPGLPDLGGGTDPPDPVNPRLVFGTTLFGQSYARYMEGVIAAGNARYDATESSTVATIGGVERQGSAVIRLYNDAGAGPGTWNADAHPSYIRDGQPVIFSWKWPRAVSEATAKAEFADFLDSKPTDSEFAWLANWHEPDNDIYPSGGAAQSLSWSQWANQNTWCREVIDDYPSRTDFKFGMITTGNLWRKGQGRDNQLGWRTWYNDQAANAGGRTDVWDFMGGDRYNPAWNNPDHVPGYLDIDDWVFRKRDMFDMVGLPFIVGEIGSARAAHLNFPGETIAQRDQRRATWIRNLFNRIKAEGFFDACAWWRVPALPKGGGLAGAFSTIMIAPTGTDADIIAAGKTPPPGGVDAQVVLNVHSEFCQQSMLDADPPIPFWTS